MTATTAERTLRKPRPSHASAVKKCLRRRDSALARVEAGADLNTVKLIDEQILELARGEPPRVWWRR